MKKIVVIFLFFCLMFIPLSTVVHAQQNQPSNKTLESNAVINHDYFNFGNTVTILGVINGDAYVGGGTVNIDGTINGDLLAAGGSINVNGKVNGNIRAIGATVTLSSQTGRNVSVAAGNLNITPSSSIGGSLSAAAGSVSLGAPIGKDVNVAGGNLIFSSPIGGNVNASSSNIILSPGTKIAGDLNYWSNNRTNLQNSATVSGTIAFHQTTSNNLAKYPPKAPLFLTSFAFKTAEILMDAFIGLLLLLFFPSFINSVSETIILHPFKSLGIGFLILILAPFIFLLLLVTIIGIPLGILFALFLLVFGYVSKLIVAFVIGRKIFEIVSPSPKPLYLLFVVGLVIYQIISIIPVLGWLLMLITIIVGIGALSLTERNLYLRLRSNQII